jgi:hypothetical protein
MRNVQGSSAGRKVSLMKKLEISATTPHRKSTKKQYLNPRRAKPPAAVNPWLSSTAPNMI